MRQAICYIKFISKLSVLVYIMYSAILDKPKNGLFQKYTKLKQKHFK